MTQLKNNFRLRLKDVSTFNQNKNEMITKLKLIIKCKAKQVLKL